MPTGIWYKYLNIGRHESRTFRLPFQGHGTHGYVQNRASCSCRGTFYRELVPEGARLRVVDRTYLLDAVRSGPNFVKPPLICKAILLQSWSACPLQPPYIVHLLNWEFLREIRARFFEAKIKHPIKKHPTFTSHWDDNGMLHGMQHPITRMGCKWAVLVV